jgi:hypothetical protein
MKAVNYNTGISLEKNGGEGNVKAVKRPGYASPVQQILSIGRPAEQQCKRCGEKP